MPELLNRLRDTTRTYETVEEYKAMKKGRPGTYQGYLGGFVGGHLENGRRVKGSVKNRSLVTLDVDYADSTFWTTLRCYMTVQPLSIQHISIRRSLQD